MARFVILALLACPAVLGAQQPVPAVPDSLHQHGDSLHRTPAQLQEVTVTATPARREEPRSAVTITPAAIAASPAADPYELLRQTAGVEVHDQGQGPGFASDASVRGFSSDHSTDLALWVDGVPINEPVNGHAEGYNDWSLLFPDAIRSIDVLKGPASPLYGNFALAGVVNVRTLERITGVLASAKGGAYGRMEGSLLTGFDHDKAGGVFGFRGVREDGWRPNAGYELGQGHARLVRDLSGTTTLDAGAELYAAGWDSPGFLTTDQYDARAFRAISDPTDGGFKRRAQERVSVRVIPETTIPLTWRSTLYATQGRWQLFLTTPPEGGGGEGSGSQTEEEDRRYGFGATSALTMAFRRIEATLGAEGRWDHADFEQWFTTSRQRDSAATLVNARQASGALFLQSITDVGHHLRFNIGGRYDVLGTRSMPDDGPATSDTKGIFSPKLGALLHLKRYADLYANVSRGFRQTDGVIEDPTLPFITAWAYETGVKLDFPWVNATAALFRMDVSNEQTFDPVTLASTSGGRSRRQGVELTAHARLTDAVHVITDWTFTDAKYRAFVTEDGDTLTGARVFNTAKYVGAATVELAPPAAIWQLQLGTNVVGPYTPFDEADVTLPAYGLLHAGGRVLLKGVVLELGVRNLLDRTYPELRAGGFVVPGQPRSVYGSVRYAF